MKIVRTVSRYANRDVFLSAFLASVLLMASGLFIGTIGIDDEFNALSSSFDSTGRGLWAQHIVTILLPGQLGVTFAPMIIGCLLYAFSIAIIVNLWRLSNKWVACTCAALAGSFPYFASMMTFDVAQIAYPMGFVLIALSLALIFDSNKFVPLALSVLAFGLAFAFYQGVATTFASGWVSTVGMRYFADSERNRLLSPGAWAAIRRTLFVVLIGSLIYLLTVELSQILIPHTEWGDSYSVNSNLAFYARIDEIYRNIKDLLTGRSGDLPVLASVFFFAGIGLSLMRILFSNNYSRPKKILFVLGFLASVLVVPFWLLFVQSSLLSPRSAVGIGMLYAYLFAFLVDGVQDLSLYIATGMAGVMITHFVFVGNQMFYTQFLSSQADQVAVTRIASRIDAVASREQLRSPVSVVLVGRYAPAGGQYAKYDTIGSSPLDWDAGNVHRQAALFRLLGVDGIVINRDSAVINEVLGYVLDRGLPSWPDPGSVFLYKKDSIVVNLGSA